MKRRYDGLERRAAPAGRAAALALAAAAAVLGGCAGRNSSDVLPAVVGLEGASAAPYRVGKIPDPVVRPGDRVIGRAANKPDQCIYHRARSTRRFRADCPAGYKP